MRKIDILIKTDITDPRPPRPRPEWLFQMSKLRRNHYKRILSRFNKSCRKDLVKTNITLDFDHRTFTDWNRTWNLFNEEMKYLWSAVRRLGEVGDCFSFYVSLKLYA